MKATIAGVRYDTDKAELLDFVAVGNPGDPHAFTEALYRSPRARRLFLFGEGGPHSRYAEQAAPGQWRYGSRVIPMQEADAARWVRQHRPERLRDLFGDQPKG